MLVAADESIRKAEDPFRVVELDAADIAVLKVAPLGGVAACLSIARDIGLPVVVSSAVDSSIGLAAGVALAAALPELPYACGLGTQTMLLADVVADPLVPVGGFLPVRRPAVDPHVVERAAADPDRADWWLTRAHRVAPQQDLAAYPPFPSPKRVDNAPNLAAGREGLS